MANPHWQYFLALEASLEQTTRYVEMTPLNYATFSVEFARILLSASSEVDVMAKQLCRAIDPVSSPTNINEYRRCILSRYERFPEFEIRIPRYDLVMRPWDAWKSNVNPNWWKGYNEVKHERSIHFEKANLENTVNAIAGLFCLELAASRNPAMMSPWPSLVQVDETVLCEMVLAYL